MSGDNKDGGRGILLERENIFYRGMGTTAKGCGTTNCGSLSSYL
jgi:hypothetical protein